MTCQPTTTKNSCRRLPAASGIAALIASLGLAAVAALPLSGVQASVQASASASAPASADSLAQGRLIALCARQCVGVTPFRPGGTDLKTGADNDSFVAAVFKAAGTTCPEPPVASMAMFGDIVAWQPGAEAVMDGKVVTLPEGEGALYSGLQSGDRIFLQSNPAGAAEARETARLRTGGDQKAQWAAEAQGGGLLVGIYIGSYESGGRPPVRNGVVLVSPSRKKAVVVDLDDPDIASRFRFATRGTRRRFVLDSAGKVVRNSGPISPAPIREKLDGSVAVLCVGLSRYGGNDDAHPGGAAGAKAAWDEMKRLYGSRIDKSRSAILVTGGGANDLPTRERLSGAILDAARGSKPGDTILLYFSGLGSGSTIYPAEFVPGDASGASAASTAISLDDLVRQMAAFPARRFLFILDYPGAMAPHQGMGTLKGTGKEAAAFVAAAPKSPARRLDSLRRAMKPGTGVTEALTAGQVRKQMLEEEGFDLFQVTDSGSGEVTLLAPSVTPAAPSPSAVAKSEKP